MFKIDKNPKKIWEKLRSMGRSHFARIYGMYGLGGIYGTKNVIKLYFHHNFTVINIILTISMNLMFGYVLGMLFWNCIEWIYKRSSK